MDRIIPLITERLSWRFWFQNIREFGYSRWIMTIDSGSNTMKVRREVTAMALFPPFRDEKKGPSFSGIVWKGLPARLLSTEHRGRRLKSTYQYVKLRDDPAVTVKGEIVYLINHFRHWRWKYCNFFCRVKLGLYFFSSELPFLAGFLTVLTQDSLLTCFASWIWLHHAIAYRPLTFQFSTYHWLKCSKIIRTRSWFGVDRNVHQVASYQFRTSRCYCRPQ